jgi:hypothetical protein
VDTRALQQGYGSLGGIGESLSKLAGVLTQTDKQVKAAEDTATRASKLGQFLQVLGEEEDSIINDPQVPPLLRDENLRFRMDERSQALLEDVADENLRLRLEGEMREAVAIRQREIRTRGREDFIKGAVVGITATTEQLQAQYLKTADPLARSQIRQTQTELYSQAEATGIFSAGTTAMQMQKHQDESTLAEAQALVVAQPALAEQHFLALAQGKPGLEGLPVPPMDKVPVLLNAAQNEVDEQLQRAEAVRAHGERALARAHDTNRVKLGTAIENATSQGELDRLLRVVQAAGGDAGADGVSREGFESLQADIRRRRKTLEEKVKDAKSNPNVLEPLEQRILLGRGLRSTAETQMLRNQVVAAVDSGQLLWKDAKNLVEDLNKEGDEDNPVNNPVVQRERAGLVRTMISKSEYEGFSQEEAAMQVLALRLYDDTIEQTFQQDLIGGARAAEHKAVQIRRDIEDQYNETTIGTLLKKLREEPPQVPPEVLNESQLSEGSTHAEIDAAFGRAKAEVARRYAQGTYTSTQALAYQAQLEKRLAWWQRVARPPAATPQGKRRSRGGLQDNPLLAPGGR